MLGVLKTPQPSKETTKQTQPRPPTRPSSGGDAGYVFNQISEKFLD